MFYRLVSTQCLGHARIDSRTILFHLERLLVGAAFFVLVVLSMDYAY